MNTPDKPLEDEKRVSTPPVDPAWKKIRSAVRNLAIAVAAVAAFLIVSKTVDLFTD